MSVYSFDGHSATQLVKGQWSNISGQVPLFSTILFTYFFSFVIYTILMHVKLNTSLQRMMCLLVISFELIILSRIRLSIIIFVIKQSYEMTEINYVKNRF